MSLHLFRLLLIVVVISACGTKPNTDVCCIGAADCGQFDLEEDRPCADGLTCVNNDCVATSCETEGCPLEQPVCNVVSEQCEGCAGPDDCMEDAATPVCNVESGVCVGCVANGDCNGTTPICDDTQCRGCTDDVDCESGACGDDGACVAEADIAYVSRTGVDVSPCSKEAPCARIQFAGQQLTGSRRHIVMFPGDYLEGPFLSGGADLESMVLHGGGASLSCECGDGLINAGLEIEIRHLSMQNGAGVIASLALPTLLRDVRVRGRVLNRGNLTVLDSYFDGGTDVGLDNSGAATVLRTEFVGGVSGIRAEPGSLTSLENVLIHGSSDVGIEMRGGTGSIAFSTITNTGSASSDVRGIRCTSSSFSVLSSIVWAPQQPALPGVSNCRVEGSLVGPIQLLGEGNISSDPLFVNAAAGDLHLSPTSPARDRATQGPPVDFDGDPRPAGTGFDLGADEIQ